MRSIIAISASLLLVNVVLADDADDVLEKNLRHAINQRHVDIDVDKGVVEIEGEVRSDQDRQAIDAVVRSTPGVAAIKNNLKVKFATPVTATYAPALRPSVPVYMTPPPAVTTGAPVINTPAPVVVPDYPKLRVQPWSEQDVTMANSIARQLRSEPLPATSFENVTISVRNGTATLQGGVSQSVHDALIASLQKGSGLTAIYDQMQVK
jgi:hypothetical protein